MSAVIEKIEYKSVGETVYTGELPNGLKIFVVKKPGFSSAYAVFGTHYGGAMRRFEIDGEKIDTPAGVAHFLEHKMFDMPDGNDALTAFSKNGADANAFTSSDLTCYHFSCTSRFEENLRLLLKFVSTPYYTPETVQKEQGIIQQEILMGDDSPVRRIYYNLLSILFAHHPIRDAVVGTVESIAEITDKTLYDCHRVFYAPSNMMLCVEGDVDPEAVFSIAEEMLPPERHSIPHADFGEDEGLLPLKERIEEKMPVAVPVFLLGAKMRSVPLDGSRESVQRRIRERLIAALSMRLLFSSSAPLFTRLYADGTLTQDFDYDTDYAADAPIVIVGAEAPDIEKALQEVHAEIARISSGGFDPAYFDRIKKATIGSRLRGLEDFDNVCITLVGDWFDGFCTFDAMEMLQDITREDCSRWVAENLAPERCAVSVLYPPEGPAGAAQEADEETA